MPLTGGCYNRRGDGVTLTSRGKRAGKGPILMLVKLAGAALLFALFPQAAFAAGDIGGATMGVAWALPFAGMLLSIALGPILFPHFWELNYGKFAAFWAVLVVVPLVLFRGVDPALGALLHTALLVYMSDRTLASTAARPHGLPWGKRMTASLDHSVWIHRPVRLDSRWLLYASESPVAHAARGIIFGGIYQDGLRIASVAQEALIRVRL